MKKKSLAAILCLAMAASLTGCGGGSKSDDKDYAIENDYVQVAQYKGVEAEGETAEVEVTDDEIETQIQTDLESLATTKEIKNRAAKKGDTVNIDFSGSQDGEPIENTEGADYDLELGSDSFIPGFEDEIVGLKAGDEKEFDITFPDDYANSEELRGQEVTFKVKVNMIKEITVPELTDETAHKFDSEYETVDDYKTGVKERLQEQKEEDAKENIEDQVWEKILNDSNVKEMPDERVDAMKDMLDHFYHKIAETNGIEFEDFIEQQMNATQEEYEENVEKAAKQSVGQQLIVEAIAEEEGLTISDDDYDEKAEEYAENMGFSGLEELEDYYGKDYVMSTITAEKVMSFCADEAKITESSDETSAEEEEDSSN